MLCIYCVYVMYLLSIYYLYCVITNILYFIIKNCKVKIARGACSM